MVDSGWTTQQQHIEPRGWAIINTEKGHRQYHPSWLAKVIGAKSELPSYFDEKPVGRAKREPFQRLRGLKRMLLHQLPSMDWSRQRSPRELQYPPAIPSAATVRFVLLCSLWYTTSALSSNTGKSILTLFRFPITLTFIQFGFVAAYCIVLMSPLVRFSQLRRPNMAIFRSTLPMGVFQVGGHIFSSMAISRIPVSTVHTIKALSPLFTVAAYALLFRVNYSANTYMSLLPLTVGVMLACSFDMSASNALGLLCAFGSAIVFVSQNIYFKKIVPSVPGGHSSHKLDKLNLLFYSSSMAFLLMIPIWLYYDLPVLLSADAAHIAHPTHGHATRHSVVYYLIANGTVHFAQNIIAFVILASTSPVTYSIASLIKRVAVICIAIVWFAQPVHPVQAFGITMTFGGLYLYNKAKGDVEKGEHKMRRVEAARDFALPTTKAELTSDGEMTPSRGVSPIPLTGVAEVAMSNAYGRISHHAPTPTPTIPLDTAPTNVPPPLHPVGNPELSTPSPTRPHPYLQIKITPPSASKLGSGSTPIDSYPSPPLSLDSPPSSPGVELPMRRRLTMVAGHAPSHQHRGRDMRRATVVAA